MNRAFRSEARHARKEERLEHRAAHAAAKGNFGRAARLEARADKQHVRAEMAHARGVRRALWGGRPWLRVLPIERHRIRRRTLIALGATAAVSEAMVIHSAGSYRAATEQDRAPCAAHTVVPIDGLVEVVFQRAGFPDTIVFADSYCSTCGQHFFVSPHAVSAGAPGPAAYPPPTVHAQPVAHPYSQAPASYVPPPAAYPPPPAHAGAAYPPPPQHTHGAYPPPPAYSAY